MAKKNVDYYCKDCGQSKNGWCPHLKRNGLKEITAHQCISGGGEKTPIGISYPVDTTKDEDDILAKAHEEMASTSMFPAPNVSEILRNKQEDARIIKLLKENLSLDIEQREGLEPLSSITTITLKYKDVPISDIDFGFSPFKGIYIK